MRHIEFFIKANQLQSLIREEVTGTPQELADKLFLSERATRRLIVDMKELGFKIRYSKERKTYFFSKY